MGDGRRCPHKLLLGRMIRYLELCLELGHFQAFFGIGFDEHEFSCAGQTKQMVVDQDQRAPIGIISVAPLSVSMI